MRTTYISILLSIFILFPFFVAAQIESNISPYEDSILRAHTKQMNQFFKRFNNEEDKKGRRYTNHHDRNNRIRHKYLESLFDNENFSIPQDRKQEFIDDITDQRIPKYLEFHGGEWFAEALTEFRYNGEKANLKLFLKLQQEEIGSKWVIHKVYFKPYERLFYNSPETEKKFLHPLSHEIDFINLAKVFREPQHVEYYTAKEYKPDHLSLFLYELKKSKFEFISVKHVKFHFFQIDDWYFSVEHFNRSGYNAGWLISDLLKVNESEKQLLEEYIYFRKQ